MTSLEAVHDLILNSHKLLLYSANQGVCTAKIPDKRHNVA